MTLIPKQIKQNGLKEDEIAIGEDVVLDIIRYYTREAGVRNLEREIANLMRKAVKEILMKKKKLKYRTCLTNLEETKLPSKKF